MRSLESGFSCLEVILSLFLVGIVGAAVSKQLQSASKLIRTQSPTTRVEDPDIGLCQLQVSVDQLRRLLCTRFEKTTMYLEN